MSRRVKVYSSRSQTGNIEYQTLRALSLKLNYVTLSWQRAVRATTFFELVTELTDLDPAHVWNTFERRYLVPMVRSIGANTYKLLIGDSAEIDGKHFEDMIGAFQPRYKQTIGDMIARFLDPKNDAVRDYISRLLHAYFCVEATGISDSLSKKLDSISTLPHRFRLFLDTNFLFSFLGLHENPSNPSATELHDLLTTLKQRANLQVVMYVTPKTIEEAKRALVAAKVGVSEVPLSANFTDVALRVGMSGLRQRYFLERKRRNTLLTADDWFNPYIHNFVRMSREAGVELYNEKLDRYSMRQNVIDDISLVMSNERKRLPEVRRKPYEAVAHDTILWHVVHDQRPAYVETPTEARDWILTVDFRLIGFDSYKVKRGDTAFPLCLHPTSLIQMLQFWVPRTHEFEEAMLGSLRLPFLFQAFDAQAEQTSLAILSRLGRFSGNESFSEDAVMDVLLNEGLRNRIGRGRPYEEEIELVKDAYLVEIQRQLEKDKEEKEHLSEQQRKQDTELIRLRRESKLSAKENRTIRCALESERVEIENRGRHISELAESNLELKEEVKQSRAKSQRQKTLLTYICLTATCVILAGTWGLFAPMVYPLAYHRLGNTIAFSLSVVVAWVVLQTIAELVTKDRLRIDQLKGYKLVVNFRRWIGRTVFALIIGAVSSAIGSVL